MARPRRPVRCLAGEGLNLETKAEGFSAPGPCMSCGAGPLHGPPGPTGGTKCDCSFLRLGLRICRQCAVGYDFHMMGYSRITHDFLPEDVRDIVRLVWKGQRVATCGT